MKRRHLVSWPSSRSGSNGSGVVRCRHPHARAALSRAALCAAASCTAFIASWRTSAEAVVTVSTFREVISASDGGQSCAARLPRSSSA